MLANRTTFGARTTFAYRFEFADDAEEITGTLAATDGADSAAISGLVLVVGSLSGTEGADVGAVTGDVIVNGTLAGTEGADAASFSGEVIVSGSLAATEGADAADFSGTVTAADVTGTLDATEGADGAEFAGSVESEQPAQEIEFVGDGFKRNSRAEEDRLKADRDDKENLKRVVRLAFQKVTGEPEPVPVTRRVEKEIAKAAVTQMRQDGIKFDGLPQIQQTLAAITELIRNYEGLLEQQQANEDDTIAILLLVA
jgi:hypothetical protein